MQNEVIPAGKDMEQVAAAIGSIISPLAASQAETQKAAMQADIERLRMNLESQDKAGLRAHHTGLILIGIAACCMAGFFLIGKPEFVMNALWFAGGSAAGYGYGTRKKIAG